MAVVCDLRGEAVEVRLREPIGAAGSVGGVDFFFFVVVVVGAVLGVVFFQVAVWDIVLHFG